MSSPIRLAIVGAGRMGEYHARTLLGHGELALTSLVDPSAEVRRLAGELGVAHTFEDVEALMAADVADAWIVAAPTPLHPRLVKTAAANGIPILCEKPLSLDLGVGQELEQLDHARLQVGFWRRFSAPWAAAKLAIDSGTIGRPVMLRLTQWDANPPPPSFCDPAVSGGLAVDCGIHEFDLAEWLTGSTVSRVLARATAPVDEAVAAVGDVDNLVALLELGDGSLATVDLSRNSRYGDDVRTEILGSEGALFVDTLPAGRLRVAGSRGMREIPEASCADAMGDGVLTQALAFVRTIDGSPEDVPGAHAANRALAIALAARESLGTGDWVSVPSPGEPSPL